VRIFNEIPDRAPEFILKEIHSALAKTRGAAVSVAEVMHRTGALNYAGVGNISTVVYSGGKTRSVVSMNGTVGHTVAKFQQFSYPWESNSMLIMHSDGVGTRWNLEQYSGLAPRHPALIAAVLYRDFTRERDDATILVTRDKGQ
jgi:Stage II sporulation protein E (SpoIIE)